VTRPPPGRAKAGEIPVGGGAREPDDSVAWRAFDALATLVAVVRTDGTVVHANAAFEQVLGLSRRAVQRSSFYDWFGDAAAARETVVAVARNDFSTSRFEALLKRGPGAGGELLPVQAIVNQIDPGGGERVVVELVEHEQQARQDREERVHEQSQLTRELVRNLAHEIKNPLGGIRGAAQLLQMEIGAKPLAEYTQVIIHEADRLQALVDRLLAPHRRPHVVGDVNIHEVCERVRSLLLAEFAGGLDIVRDYDASLPEFRGDREQLIQAVLNIAQNAAQALEQRIAAGDARIVLRTRAARQVTIGKQRWRLALELHIQDNGPGVPEPIRDRMFYPLVTGREGGSGLGLTLAQTFVQQHDGTIDCASRPGETVFRILIPLP
jgi:two-component system nitrogen regulation sensor histidine kinase GlnL